MECYGSKRFGKNDECATCDLRGHCQDAKDIPSMGHSLLVVEPPAPEPHRPSEVFEPGLLRRIVDAAQKQPKGFAAFTAMLESQDSLATMAKSLGYRSKQAVHYQLLRFSRTAGIPEQVVARLLIRRQSKLSQAFFKAPSWMCQAS